MAVETSIVTSLDELRSIHLQRVADERASFEAERIAVADAARRRAEADRAAIDAKLRDERDAQIRIEEARVTSEREARLKLEAIENAERARHVAELETARQAQEMELRRAEVLKKRPRWMLAVTAIALVGGIGFGYFAWQRSQDADAAAAQRIAAEHQKDEAKQKARESEQQLTAMLGELDRVHEKLEVATKDLNAKQSAIDIGRTRMQMEKARAEEAAVRKQIEALKEKKAHDERMNGSHQEGCTGTALGCIK
jgi:DNA repair exonuclease SbcCD ATPase subunit